MDPYGYIIKPFKGREVWVTIEMALHKREMEEELRKYREHLEELVAERTTALEMSNKQLLQSQKMKCVGRLAGGIAHDFNNLLTPIMGYAQLGLAQLPPGASLSTNFEEIQKAAERASNLTRQLLAFSRFQVVEPKVINLNGLITNLDKMLRRLIGEDIELETLPACDLNLVRVDPSQIEQVLINLAINAHDAMPHGGRLTIQSANVILDKACFRQHADASPGPYVMLAVTDTGVGMTEEVKNHIFEPFFTTKEDGKGTGLGLATCYGIVRQSGGHIEVHSEVGLGTTFKIYLPSVEGGVQAPDQCEVFVDIPWGSETVLLAEDEPGVRNLAAHVLRSQGYTVLEAANGVEAVHVAEKHSQDIHLLLTDVVMPKMSGIELAHQLKSMRPDIRVLFTSGYMDGELGCLGDLGSAADFIHKPFQPIALSRKVRDVLTSPKSGTLL